MFLWRLFRDGLQGGFQLISRLELRLEFMALFQCRTPDMIVQTYPVVSTLQGFNKPGTVRLQPVLHDAQLFLFAKMVASKDKHTYIPKIYNKQKPKPQKRNKE